MRESAIERRDTGGKSDVKQPSAMPGDSKRPRLETKKWSGLRLNYARTHELPQILSKRGSPSKANSSARRPPFAASANRKTVFREARSFCPMNSPSSTKPWIAATAPLSPVEVGANDGHRTPRAVQEMTGLRHNQIRLQIISVERLGVLPVGFRPSKFDKLKRPRRQTNDSLREAPSPSPPAPFSLVQAGAAMAPAERALRA